MQPRQLSLQAPSVVSNRAHPPRLSESLERTFVLSSWVQYGRVCLEAEPSSTLVAILHLVQIPVSQAQQLPHSAQIFRCGNMCRDWHAADNSVEKLTEEKGTEHKDNEQETRQSQQQT